MVTATNKPIISIAGAERSAFMIGMRAAKALRMDGQAKEIEIMRAEGGWDDVLRFRAEQTPGVVYDRLVAAVRRYCELVAAD